MKRAFLVVIVLASACAKQTEPAEPAPSGPPPGASGKQRAAVDDVPGVVEAKALLGSMADQSFDVATALDPSAPLVYLDYTKAGAQELCASDAGYAAAIADLTGQHARLKDALAGGAVSCGALANGWVRCAVLPGGGFDDTLLYSFELVLGEAQLRAFGREQAGNDEAERDAALARLATKKCK